MFKKLFYYLAIPIYLLCFLLASIVPEKMFVDLANWAAQKLGIQAPDELSSLVATGSEGFVGQIAIVVNGFSTQNFGKVKLRGEIWDATLVSASGILVKGNKVRVVRVEGFKLFVEIEGNTSL